MRYFYIISTLLIVGSSVFGQGGQDDFSVRCVYGGLEIVQPFGTECEGGAGESFLFEFYYGPLGSEPDLWFPFNSIDGQGECETHYFHS